MSELESCVSAFEELHDGDSIYLGKDLRVDRIALLVSVLIYVGVKEYAKDFA